MAKTNAPAWAALGHQERWASPRSHLSSLLASEPTVLLLLLCAARIPSFFWQGTVPFGGGGAATKAVGAAMLSAAKEQRLRRRNAGRCLDKSHGGTRDRVNAHSSLSNLSLCWMMLAAFMLRTCSTCSTLVAVAPSHCCLAECRVLLGPPMPRHHGRQWRKACESSMVD